MTFRSMATDRVGSHGNHGSQPAGTADRPNGQIAQKETDASGWKYPPEQQRARESENAATQTDDQNDPNQVIESQSLQAVKIASRDANSRLGSMACPVCV